MSRCSKAICAGLGTGLIGIVISVTFFGMALEENFGLHLLFKLRGARKAPPDVVVVATESASENKLKLPTHLTKWPRALHARLIDNLAAKNAAVIVFDIFYGSIHSGRQGQAGGGV
jgi:adenylate cyclase